MGVVAAVRAGLYIGRMSAGLILIVIIVSAYLAAHVLFDWLGRRFLIVSGAEYLLLGILVGPEVSGLLNASVVGQFAPFMTLALAWIGALIGAQFDVAGLLRIQSVYYRVAFIEAFATLTVTSGLAAAMLVLVLGAPTPDALIAGIALGAIATASAPSGIALVTREFGRRGQLVQQLEVTTAIDALVAIVAFGMLLSIVHPPPIGPVRPPTPTEWAVISLAIGFVGGALFHLFLGDETDPDRLFIALGGALVLASGAAAYLKLSPLLPALIIGAVLVNTSRNAVMIRNVLGGVERPLYYVLLLFVGAAWSRQPGTLWLVPVALFLVLRVIAKLGSARLAARLQGTLPALGSGWGRALLGHGGLAVAIAFNYHLLPDMPYRHIVFTAAIVSVLLTDITSARLVREVMASYRRRATATLQGALGIASDESRAALGVAADEPEETA
jgi:Kef-type K+ transport system membrane component KefB